MANAVEVRGLKAWFGKTEALHGINMTVESNHARRSSGLLDAANQPSSAV